MKMGGITFTVKGGEYVDVEKLAPAPVMRFVSKEKTAVSEAPKNTTILADTSGKGVITLQTGIVGLAVFAIVFI